MRRYSWQQWIRVCALSAGAAFLLTGCEPDDQTSIKPEHKIIADPAPVSKDGKVATFQANNDKHKIILAVFDTGADYNHPYLRDHMHFDLDEKGNPVGLGVDFLTLEDKWASHRLIKTSSYEFKDLSERQQKNALRTYKAEEVYNDDVRRSKMGRVCAVETLLKVDPSLAKWTHPYRDIDAEVYKLTHGSHVSGLMSYDDERIGLIPYRVLPYFETEKDEADFARGKADKFVTNFETALIHARKRNVKIVNLSLGGSFTKPTNTNDASYERNLEKFQNYKRLLTEGLTKLVKNYPEILFVAAAGNDSGWSDNKSRLQYPCGIEAPNILCVGALDKDGELVQFTNLPVNQIDLVLAPGQKLISAIPSDQCEYLQTQFDKILAAGTDHAGLCTYDRKAKKWNSDEGFIANYKPLISTIAKVCSREKSLFEAMSGTSMATPLVSRIAAKLWLEKPSMKPEEVIKALRATAKVEKGLLMPLYSLSVEKPSWYGQFEKGGEGSPLVPDNGFKPKPSEKAPVEKTGQAFPLLGNFLYHTARAAAARHGVFSFVVSQMQGATKAQAVEAER